MINYVIKKDKRIVSFNQAKIAASINGAFFGVKSSSIAPVPMPIQRICDDVVKELNASPTNTVTTATIKAAVVKHLEGAGYPATARRMKAI